MLGFVARRALQALVLLFVVSVVTFAIIHAAPGGPAILTNPDISREQAEQMMRNLGLTDPVAVQFWRWFRNAIRGELGKSYSQGLPVLPLVLERMPASLLLAGSALAFAVAVAIPLGIVSAVRRYSLVDTLAGAVSVFGLSIPVFWFGIIAIIVFGVHLKWLPSGGMYTLGVGFSLADRLRHLLLPALVLGTILVAQLERYTRSSMLTEVQADYVRTARAKGMAERRVLSRHALRNALIPVVTVIGLSFPRLVGQAAITETVFAWPGMGRLAVDSAFQRDYPVIMGVTLVISAMVIVSNLLTDILYGALDPRIKPR
jgi:peptide/nickel transport system permease protein